MKTKLVILTICLAIIGLSVEARVKVKDAKQITGQSLTEFGNYAISKADVPLILNGEEVKTYELVYDNSNRKVQIGVVPEKKCTSFVLKSDMFEIEYVCTRGVFGVKKIEKKYREFAQDINEAVLDKVGYYQQRVICRNEKTEQELLGLIACYFPNLIKEKYLAKF